MAHEAKRYKPRGNSEARLHPRDLIQGAMDCPLFWEDIAETRAKYKVSENTLWAVMMGLVSYHGADGKMYPSNATLAHKIRLSERQVTAARGCLAEFGVIRCIIPGGRKNSMSNTYTLDKVLLTKYREAYLRTAQIVQGTKVETHPPASVAPKPEGFLENYTPTTTTVVEGGRSDTSNEEEKCKPPPLFRAGDICTFTEDQVLQAMLDGGCTPERASERLRFGRKQGAMYAIRYGFKSLKADAEHWRTSDKRRAENSGPLTLREILLLQRDDPNFDADSWERREDELFYPIAEKAQ